MKTRIITGLIGVIAIIGILFAGEPALNLTVLAVILVCQYELMISINIKEVKPIFWGNIIFSVILFLSVLFFKELLYVALFLYIISNLFILVFSNGKIKFTSVSYAVMCMAYVFFLLIHIVLLRKEYLGIYNVILVLLGAVATDTFAYFVGVTIGKHKLCPKMSPKKTIEGAVGGITGTILVFVVYGIIVNNLFNLNVNFVSLVILALLCAVFSEVGDLSASVIKRQFEIKDFGNVLPGHGGIMDRVDSICFVAPVVYYFVTYFPVFIK